MTEHVDVWRLRLALVTCAENAPLLFDDVVNQIEDIIDDRDQQFFLEGPDETTQAIDALLRDLRSRTEVEESGPFEGLIPADGMDLLADFAAKKLLCTYKSRGFLGFTKNSAWALFPTPEEIAAEVAAAEASLPRINEAPVTAENLITDEDLQGLNLGEFFADITRQALVLHALNQSPALQQRLTDLCDGD